MKTGLSISFPAGLYARIAPRSGLALKKFIAVGAGVVDSDYRGDVGVVLFNHGDQDFQVKMGDRIAQLILERIDTPPVQEVQDLVWEFLWFHWVVANTGWHGGSCGTSVPSAGTNAAALGGSSTFTNELGFRRGLVL